MRILSIFLLILLCYFQIQLWFGTNGVAELQGYKGEVVKLETEQQEKSIRNRQMFAQIKDLKEGSNAIEEQAREEYGLIKPEETFYRVDTSKK